MTASAPAMPEGVPVIRKNVQPRKYAASTGRRAMLLGREDGTFEAWINPVKILRDFRWSVYFDGALEPVPLADFAERIAVAPGRVTITHSHAAFTIRQTWLAALESPALLILLDIDTDRPLRLRASFLPELRPMWPASFGGQSSSWSEAEKAIVLGEGLRRWYAAAGSPRISRHSEQVGHQMPDRTIYLEMDVTPEVARQGPVPFVIAGSGEGRGQAIEQYQRALRNWKALLNESDVYYRGFRQRVMRIETPEPILNHAFEWAQFALEKGWICNHGVGCGLVAGFGPSGLSERPGFAWYFGGDAFMNSWSILDSGDFDRVRDLLAFLRGYQREDGKMMHELTQSGALLDWSKYPYGYYHGDTTPLYLFSAAKYVIRSGDIAFARDSWESLEKAYRLCLTWTDDDGLLLNNKAGLAAVETGALAGRVEKDVYLQGAWLAGLDGFVKLASVAGQTALAREAQELLQKARSSLERWFLREKGYLPFGKLTDGTFYPALTPWQAMALAYGGLDPEIARGATQSLSRPEVATPWGTRLFATNSPNYDPLSYNDGSVWPFVTGFAITAQFRNGAPREGLRQLYGLAAMTGLSGAGYLTEYLSGERAQALPRSVPHQLFSSAAVVHPLVSGLLGLEGDAIAGTLLFRPAIPLAWERVSFSNYRVGRSTVAGEIRCVNKEYRVSLRISGPPLQVAMDPQFPAGAKQVSPANYKMSPLAGGSEHHWIYRVDAPAELEWRPAIPETGDRAR
jgi:hypothetical protein